MFHKKWFYLFQQSVTHISDEQQRIYRNKENDLIFLKAELEDIRFVFVIQIPVQKKHFKHSVWKQWMNLFNIFIIFLSVASTNTISPNPKTSHQIKQVRTYVHEFIQISCRRLFSLYSTFEVINYDLFYS